ncbi:hypothetical protein [Henriciella aquimarina]|uniref:hypothetical protein n=1 Tax=Henriciella aquimarina TaxID=545261 RepID=UPI0009FD43B7|nr:hypothetical protein [Henriciella aquimarina]
MLKGVGIVLVAGACLSLTACDLRWGDEDEEAASKPPASSDMADTAAPETAEPDTAPQPDNDTVRPASATRKAEIDWEAARNDLAASGERDTTFSIQSGSSAPPVPVLLPTGPVRTASAGGEPPQFRPLDDGYYAMYPGEDYTLIVNGTNEVTDAPGDASADPGEIKYTPTSTGAIVTFVRYGASYMVEFECKGSGQEGGDCISEEEALTVAEDIVISGTQ